LVLSGLVDGQGVFTADALGAIGTLAKPFTKEELVGRIRMAIAKSGLSYPGQMDSAPGLDATPRPAGAEKRRHRRFETDQSATIAQGPGINCRIVDMSHGGAGLLLFEDHFDLPNSFQIVLGDKTRHTCRVTWRQGRRLGVKFLGRTG